MTTQNLLRARPALEAEGIRFEDLIRDVACPRITYIADEPYVEAIAWQSFRTLVAARGCYLSAGFTPEELPSWCRPGTRDPWLAALANGLETDDAPAEAEVDTGLIP